MNIPKFRAYIKATGKIHQVATINLPSQTIQAYTKKVKINFDSRLTLYGFDEIELMQYIDRQDNNGEYVYEGDIIGGMYGIGFIEYDDTQSQYMINIFGCKQEVYLNEIDQRHLIIIGNIYQNPEKLEEL